MKFMNKNVEIRLKTMTIDLNELKMIKWDPQESIYNENNASR